MSANLKAAFMSLISMFMRSSKSNKNNNELTIYEFIVYKFKGYSDANKKLEAKLVLGETEIFR